MVSLDITFDADEVLEEISILEKMVHIKGLKALDKIALEILRLSSFEVPHDTGMLQASGTKEKVRDEVLVGYNKVYAARLHENPQYNFQKGRKGKYLEDPIKNNLKVFLEFYKKALSEIK